VWLVMVVSDLVHSAYVGLGWKILMQGGVGNRLRDTAACGATCGCVIVRNWERDCVVPGLVRTASYTRDYSIIDDPGTLTCSAHEYVQVSGLGND
jgi:hypothetical protein